MPTNQDVKTMNIGYKSKHCGEIGHLVAELVINRTEIDASVCDEAEKLYFRRKRTLVDGRKRKTLPSDPIIDMSFANGLDDYYNSLMAINLDQRNYGGSISFGGLSDLIGWFDANKMQKMQ